MLKTKKEVKQITTKQRKWTKMTGNWFCCTRSSFTVPRPCPPDERYCKFVFSYIQQWMANGQDDGGGTCTNAPPLTTPLTTIITLCWNEFQSNSNPKSVGLWEVSVDIQSAGGKAKCSVCVFRAFFPSLHVAIHAIELCPELQQRLVERCRCIYQLWLDRHPCHVCSQCSTTVFHLKLMNNH